MRSIICFILLIYLSNDAAGQKLSNRICGHLVPIDTIIKRNISSVEYGDYYAEKFDEYGNISHNKYKKDDCCNWIINNYSLDTVLQSSYHTFNKDTVEIRFYHYNSNGLINIIQSIKVYENYIQPVVFDEAYKHRRPPDTIKFEYNEKNQLVQYKDQYFTERYKYDSFGNIIEIKTKFQEGEFDIWTGEYDAQHRLIKETSNRRTIILTHEYDYDSNENILSIKITSKMESRSSWRIEKKYYVDGLLQKVELYNSKGELERTDLIKYEF